MQPLMFPLLEELDVFAGCWQDLRDEGWIWKGTMRHDGILVMSGYPKNKRGTIVPQYSPSDRYALLRYYPDAPHGQAYLCLDMESGEVTVKGLPKEDTTPSTQKGTMRRWPIPAHTNAEELAYYMRQGLLYKLLRRFWYTEYSPSLWTKVESFLRRLPTVKGMWTLEQMYARERRVSILEDVEYYEGNFEELADARIKNARDVYDCGFKRERPAIIEALKSLYKQAKNQPCGITLEIHVQADELGDDYTHSDFVRYGDLIKEEAHKRGVDVTVILEDSVGARSSAWDQECVEWDQLEKEITAAAFNRVWSD